MLLPSSSFSSANFALTLAVIHPSVTTSPVVAAACLLFRATSPTISLVLSAVFPAISFVLSPASFVASKALSAPCLVASIALPVAFFVSFRVSSVHAEPAKTTQTRIVAIRHFEKVMWTPSLQPITAESQGGRFLRHPRRCRETRRQLIGFLPPRRQWQRPPPGDRNGCAALVPRSDSLSGCAAIGAPAIASTKPNRVRRMIRQDRSELP